MSKKLSTTVIK